MTNTTAYPEDLGPESAFYSLDGPTEQVRADLCRIIALCSKWPTAEAKRLAEEAKEYLAELVG